MIFSIQLKLGKIKKGGEKGKGKRKDPVSEDKAINRRRLRNDSCEIIRNFKITICTILKP